MLTALENFKLALSVLTRIPIMKVDMGKADWPKSCGYFPICGYLIAIPVIIPALIFHLLNIAFPSILLSAWSIFCLITLTGAMHLDGFADICDGFGCHADKKRRIEIMHDPRVGSFGIAGMIILLLIKFAAFTVIYNNGRIFQAASIIVLSRTFLVITTYFSKPSEKKGMGALVLKKINKKTIIFSLIISIPCFIYLNTLIAAIIMFLGVILVVKKSYKLIGGLNGDVIGALCEISEAIGLFTIAVIASF
jgi:adenosylcobinamide-GDP ribazoletransferase